MMLLTPLVALIVAIFALGFLLLRVVFVQTLLAIMIGLAMATLAAVAYAPIWVWQRTVGRRGRRLAFGDYFDKVSMFVLVPPFIFPPFIAMAVAWNKEGVLMGIFAFVVATIISAIQACRLLTQQS